MPGRDATARDSAPTNKNGLTFKVAVSLVVAYGLIWLVIIGFGLSVGPVPKAQACLLCNTTTNGNLQVSAGWDAELGENTVTLVQPINCSGSITGTACYVSASVQLQYWDQAAGMYLDVGRPDWVEPPRGHTFTCDNKPTWTYTLYYTLTNGVQYRAIVDTYPCDAVDAENGGCEFFDTGEAVFIGGQGG